LPYSLLLPFYVIFIAFHPKNLFFWKILLVFCCWYVVLKIIIIWTTLIIYTIVVNTAR
jgi:hypothetical protein